MMSLLTNLDWREPAWLWLALYPWVIWSMRWLILKPAGQNYADSALLPWATAQNHHPFKLGKIWHHGLLVISWVLIAMSMAGPRLPGQIISQDESDYLELMIVLDVSRSMTARDIVPSRLERAKLEIHDLLARTDKIKTGLILYTARPHLLTPPTTDKSVLRHYLGLIEHGLVPVEGSDLNSALAFTASSFLSDKSRRVILLITDGETATRHASEQQQLETTVAGLNNEGILLYALGVGSQEGAALFAANGSWLTHQNKAVTSRLDEELLVRLTNTGNGRYSQVSETDSEWSDLYDQGIAQVALDDHKNKGSKTDTTEIVWHEMYSWFLIPAIFFLVLSKWQPGRKVSALLPVSLVCIISLSAMTFTTDLYANESNKETIAYAAYNNQNYLEAKQLYATVPGYNGRMGEGNSVYRLKMYHHAIQQFTQAILDANNDQQRANALFNLANCYYQLNQFKRSITIYQDVLRYSPAHSAASINLGYAQELHQQEIKVENTAAVKRAGTGPATARLPIGTEVIQGRLSIDESGPVQDKFQSSNITITPGGADLIDKGIHQAQPADKAKQHITDVEWQYDITTTEKIVSTLETMRTNEVQLWKRIFEGEAGFHAPVDTPQTRPDVYPW